METGSIFGDHPKHMQSEWLKSWLKQFAVVLGAWTLVALIEGVANYWVAAKLGAAPQFFSAFRWPLIEQWIWACLTPAVFLLAARCPLARPHLARSFCVHVAGFLALSLLHCALANALGSPLDAPRDYRGNPLWLRFMEEIYSDVWMYWPLVCIRALMDSNAIRSRKEGEASQLQALLATSQLALLRAQIQPHFLFNTLHSITTLVRSDPAGAEDLIADLADILRASFSELFAQEMLVARELELVDCYLRIQQRRFPDRLQVHFQVSNEVLRAALPPLLLQSLVENAVIHGAAPSKKSTRIEISICREGPRLCIEVRDDGVGLSAPLAPRVGISNSRLRLKSLYGEDQSLIITAAPNGGTSAKISIPFRILSDGDSAGEGVSDNPNLYRGRRTSGAKLPQQLAQGADRFRTVG